MPNKPGEFRAHPPNRAWIKVYGKIQEDEISAVLEEVLAFSEKLTYLLLEIDISDMSGATPEARRVSAKLFNQMPPIAYALVGGTFTQRALAKLVLKAVELLRGKERQVFSFFPTSEGAIKWLDMQSREFETNSKFK